RTSDAACPFRDIARAAAENQTGIDRGAAGRQALTDALLVDPRNDDHAILSQMTALFAILHNGLVDFLARHEPRSHGLLSLEASYRRFMAGRGATTLIYRNVVRHDLMKRLLPPGVYAAYAGASPEFLDGWHGDAKGGRDGRVPLEFAHGAFRFGHALARNKYRINNLVSNELSENLEKTSLND